MGIEHKLIVKPTYNRIRKRINVGNVGILIQSNAGQVLRLNGGCGTVVSASAESVPSFDLTAYTGGLVRLDNLDLPVVFDLSSTQIADSVPLLFKHNQEQIVGHAEDIKIVLPNRILARGILSGTSARANEIKANAKNGYKWQLSVGLLSEGLYKLEAGQTAFINGKTFVGPIYVAAQNQLREISFVSIGADSNTHARLVASFLDLNMTYEEWLASLAIDAAAFTESDSTIAKRIFDNMRAVASDATATAETISASAATAVRDVRVLCATVANRTPNPVPTSTPVVTPDFTALRANAANEFDRINSIGVIAAEFNNPNRNGVSLQATAIREGWDVARTRTEMELERFRSNRPMNINAGGANGGGNGNFGVCQILECAVAQAGRLDSTLLNAAFSPQIQEAAHRRFRGRIGLQEVLYEAAVANGYRETSNFKANGRAILQAAFSTVDLPGMLSNTVNKYLMMGFMAVDDSWRRIAAIGSVPDFKEIAGYRGAGAFRFDQLPADGQIKHGTLQEASYGIKADTYAKMFGIPRTVIINDDLDYLSSIPRQLGRGGALALVHAFWAEFMDNSSFFASGNNNTSTGALSVAGLNAALTKFRKLTDENGDYIMAQVAALVVPTELEETANQLFVDGEQAGGITSGFNANPHRAKYPPIVSPYLSDTRFTGNSTTAYYLIANPADVPVIKVAFLDGVQTPTVETAEANFSQLGIEMRGFFDFGVRKQEFRGGVRSTGA
jgi:hypothetical protein